eukprot:GHRR01034514.1.p2 GENE.GHRR01034514.1~~GHRR01034514.1.p2  ORF type:complete len:142 (-),score=40.87 GHRR01034514.1:1325-1750(-)
MHGSPCDVLQVNAPNIKELLPELFQENLLRGRGLFCQAIMKAQLASPTFSPQVLALEMLILLLENPSDDSVEMAVDFCKEVGAYLQDVAPAGLHSVFERFRAILHEGAIDKRCQYMIEGLFAVRKVCCMCHGCQAVTKCTL